jgi:NAD(P)-dependent dehydrogenase (short-subunit alcohol dehydrogenase family)
MFESKPLLNQVLFVTGGNSGIGLATALLFARKGADVAIVGRSADKNAAASARIAGEGVRCLSFACDVTDRDRMGDALDSTVEQFGRLDYAFNNAGIPQYTTPLLDQRCEEFQRIMDINVRGTWLSMQLEIEHMLRLGKGVIVNTASQAGLVGLKHLPIYTASKHAVIGLTKAIALEYVDRNIRVNAICPGLIKDTDMFDKIVVDVPDLVPALAQQIPMKRLGTPAEMADATYYLMVHADYMTGQSLMLDGGTNL